MNLKHLMGLHSHLENSSKSCPLLPFHFELSLNTNRDRYKLHTCGNFNVYISQHCISYTSKPKNGKTYLSSYGFQTKHLIVIIHDESSQVSLKWYLSMQKKNHEPTASNLTNIPRSSLHQKRVVYKWQIM